MNGSSSPLPLHVAALHLHLGAHAALDRAGVHTASPLSSRLPCKLRAHASSLLFINRWGHETKGKRPTTRIDPK